VPAQWTQPNTSFPQLRELALVGLGNVTAPALSVLRAWLDPKAAAQRLQNLSLAGLGGLAGAGLGGAINATLYRNLTTLVLANLSLGGTLPAAWASLPAGKLTALDVSGNNLTGPLPTWLASLVAPQPGWLLDVSRNSLNGARSCRVGFRGVWLSAVC
jgi:hypothetical protein